MQSPYVTLPAQSATPTLSSASTDSLRQLMLKLGTALVQFLAPDDCIQVRKVKRHGQALWLAYDRYTDQHLEFTSEQEVSNWLAR